MTDDGRMTDERLATFVWNRDQYDHASWRINAGAATELLDALIAERSRLKATERARLELATLATNSALYDDDISGQLARSALADAAGEVLRQHAKEASHG